MKLLPKFAVFGDIFPLFVYFTFFDHRSDLLPEGNVILLSLKLDFDPNFLQAVNSFDCQKIAIKEREMSPF